MIEFWIGAALLLLAAIALVWFPVLRSTRMQRIHASEAELELKAYQDRVDELDSELDRDIIDQSRYQLLRAELDRSFLAARSSTPQTAARHASGRQPAGRSGKQLLAIGLSLLLVPAVALLYFNLGSSQVLFEMDYQRDLAQQMAHLTAAQRIQRLEQELESRPDNPDLVYVAARSYMEMQDYPKAIAAYDRLVQLSQGHPEVLAEYAQASFYMEGNRVGARARELARLAIARQPNNSTALGLLGIDAFENRRYHEAIEYWQSILDANPDIGEAESLRIGIARAKAMAGETAASKPVAEGPRLALNVSLSSELASGVSPEDTLFVFARAVSGPPMPLAALRLRAGDLPQDVVLSDANAMTPAATLSMAEEVNLVARISKSGTPQGQAGDFEGRIGPIKVKSTQSRIKLVIDKVVE